jgi:hypothetical protein
MGSGSPSGGGGGGKGGGGNGGGNGLGSASSLQFSATYTVGGSEQYTQTWSAKNIGTSNMMMRIEFAVPGQSSMVYIVNGVQRKAWVYSSGEWIAQDFDAQWINWDDTWQGFQGSLEGWAGVGDMTYNIPNDPNGGTIRLHDISVNPNLSDSLFQQS